MQMDEKALRKTQESPAKPQGFAGRSVLLSGLLEGSRHKAEQEILASRFVLETAMQFVAARETLEKYEFLIIEQASYISQGRAGAASAIPAQKAAPKKPQNEDEAILSAIERIGFEPKLVGKKVAPSGNFIFNIQIAGSVCSVMLPKETMSKDDPVAYAEEYARKQGIHTKGEEHSEMMERRRVSRPDLPALESLGIDKGSLDRRVVTYEGGSNGHHHFTYLPEEIGTTFTVPTSFSGKSLLAEIDRKIFSTHIQYMKPFVPSVMEEGMDSVKATARIESIAQGDIKAIAKALDILVNGTEIDASMVPKEYLEAWTRVRASKQFEEYSFLCRRGVLMKDEAEMFVHAMDMVGHPTDGIVRAWLRLHIREDGTLSDTDSEELKDMLRRSERNPNGICDKAMRNLAEAYAALSGDRKVLTYDTGRLESWYFEMTIRIRKAVREMLPSDMLKLVD